MRKLTILGIVAAIGLLAVPSYIINTKTETTTLEIVDKERLLSVNNSTDGTSSSSYKNFVYTDSETYVVEDSIWNGHFRSGTVWARIPQDGATCEVTLVGIRAGFLSMYQNIIEANCVKGE